MAGTGSTQVRVQHRRRASWPRPPATSAPSRKAPSQHARTTSPNVRNVDTEAVRPVGGPMMLLIQSRSGGRHRSSPVAAVPGHRRRQPRVDRGRRIRRARPPLADECPRRLTSQVLVCSGWRAGRPARRSRARQGPPSAQPAPRDLPGRTPRERPLPTERSIPSMFGQGPPLGRTPTADRGARHSSCRRWGLVTAHLPVRAWRVQPSGRRTPTTGPSVPSDHVRHQPPWVWRWGSGGPGLVRWEEARSPPGRRR